jgi:ABC-type proline/glycine betaine transport system permease subunit
MRPVWAWRLMMLVAIPSLALLGIAVASQLPYVLADPTHRERQDVLLWAGVVVAAALSLAASFAFRRRGRLTPAILLAAVVALPALAMVGFLALIVGIFIAKDL